MVAPGTERDLLRPMHVTVIPGVGPATAERLRRAGIHTVADLERVSLDELVRLLGKAHGAGLYALARADDDRPVVSERETKSVSVEGTYDTDLTDRKLMEGLLTRQAGNVAERLRKSGLSGRTVTIKVRLHDFTTLSRSTTLPSPTDHGPTIARLARVAARRPGHLRRRPPARGRRLRAGRLDPGGPVRRRRRTEAEEVARSTRPLMPARHRLTWAPGMDVVHTEMGRGWVWGSGRGRGDGAVRDRRDPARAGAVVRRGRPGAQRLAPAGASRSGVNRTSSPGRSWAHCHRSSARTTPTTG